MLVIGPHPVPSAENVVLSFGDPHEVAEIFPSTGFLKDLHPPLLDMFKTLPDHVGLEDLRLLGQKSLLGDVADGLLDVSSDILGPDLIGDCQEPDHLLQGVLPIAQPPYVTGSLVEDQHRFRMRVVEAYLPFHLGLEDVRGGRTDPDRLLLHVGEYTNWGRAALAPGPNTVDDVFTALGRSDTLSG